MSIVGGDTISANYFATGDSEVPDTFLAGSNRILWEAVVLDIVTGHSPTLEISQGYKEQISNNKYLDVAPRNSLIVQIVSDGAGKEIGMNLVAYPFFPPHLSMPANPGEIVWIINEFAGLVDAVPRWICRVPCANYVDDINFTWKDRQNFQVRRTDAEVQALYKDPSDPRDGIVIPGFPNGDGTVDGATFDPDIPDPRNAVFRETLASTMTAFEPIPRFSKRPGDTVLQGSNNTLICLGTYRGWKEWQDPTTAERSNAFFEADQLPVPMGRGTIDLVAGRGSAIVFPTTKVGFGTGDGTACRVIQNTIGGYETDKYPQANDLSSPGPDNNNPPSSPDNVIPGIAQEGDPDFMTDAARVLIAQAADVDIDFGLTNVIYDNATVNDVEKPWGSPNFARGLKIPSTLDPDYDFWSTNNASDSSHLRSAVVARANDIRIVGYSHGIVGTHASDPTVHGCIRLIKEGPPSRNSSIIAMEPDCSIHVSADVIYLGRAPEDGGFEGGDNQGPGNDRLTGEGGPGVSQPWVKYQQLENLFNKILDDLKAFADTAAKNTTPGNGAPSPQLKLGGENLKKAIEERREEIVLLKSRRIFGE